jgi:hypothetical protein
LTSFILLSMVIGALTIAMTTAVSAMDAETKHEYILKVTTHYTLHTTHYTLTRVHPQGQECDYTRNDRDQNPRPVFPHGGARDLVGGGIARLLD